jgi:hypothetical protein
MSYITRPTKQGGATTYQGKVSAGYSTILASEMDLDLDTIYSAWNTGVDTVNIRDGSITGSKLAPGAVGSRELADGGIQTVDIGAQQVTTPILADLSVTTGKIAAGAVSDTQIAGVSWSKISGGAVQSGQVPLVAGGLILTEPGVGLDIQANTPASPSYDNTKPSYLVRLDYTNDSFVVLRAPPPGTAWVQIFQIAGSGVVYASLAPGSVGRTQLAVNAVQGSVAAAGNPASFSLSTANVWTNYVVLPALTTRGATVHLFAIPALSVSSNAGGGVLVGSRWVRDGTPIIGNSWLVQNAVGSFVPVPGLHWIDQSAAAGSHNYYYQVQIGVGGTMLASGTTDGGFTAYEIG